MGPGDGWSLLLDSKLTRLGFSTWCCVATTGVGFESCLKGNGSTALFAEVITVVGTAPLTDATLDEVSVEGDEETRPLLVSLVVLVDDEMVALLMAEAFGFEDA